MGKQETTITYFLIFEKIRILMPVNWILSKKSLLLFNVWDHEDILFLECQRDFLMLDELWLLSAILLDLKNPKIMDGLFGYFLLFILVYLYYLFSFTSINLEWLLDLSGSETQRVQTEINVSLSGLLFQYFELFTLQFLWFMHMILKFCLSHMFSSLTMLLIIFLE